MKLSTNSDLIEIEYRADRLYDLPIFLCYVFDEAEMSIEGRSLIGRIYYEDLDAALVFVFPFYADLELSLDNGYFAKGLEEGRMATLVSIKDELYFPFEQTYADITACKEPQEALNLAQKTFSDYLDILIGFMDYEIGYEILIKCEPENEHQLVSMLVDKSCLSENL